MNLIVDKKIMKYYQHLNEVNHDGIAKHALEISKFLRAANKNFFMSYYERLVQMYNNNNIICSKSDVNKAYNKMRINYLSYWKSKVEHSHETGILQISKYNPQPSKIPVFCKTV